MKNVLTTPKVYMLAALLAIAATAIAWQTKSKKQPGNTGSKTEQPDTTRRGKHAADKDDEFGLDGVNNIALDGLDTTIEKTIKNALGSIDFKEIGNITNEALKNIDWKEINTSVNKAMREANEQLKNIDWSEINTSVNKAMREASDELKKVDWSEINTSVNKAMREADAQLKNIDWNKINSEIKDATDKINSKEFNGEKLQDIIDNAMQKAGEGIEKAKEEVKAWKDFTSELEKDGLINKAKGYKIEWKDDGSLYINGTKQPKEISDKYHKYYKQGGYTIKIDGDETDSL